MEEKKSFFEFLDTFERTIHLPSGKDLVITGTTLRYAIIAALVLLILIIVLGVVRHFRKQRTEQTIMQPDLPQNMPEQPYNMLPDDAYMQQPLADDAEKMRTPIRPDSWGQPAETTAAEEPNTPDVAEAADDTRTVTPTEAFNKEDAKSVPSGKSTIVLIGKGGYFDRKKVTQPGEIIIGRHPQRCNLHYPENEKGISAVHCRLQKNGEQTWLTDLGSRCGTFVNGEKLKPNTPFCLQNGDTFWLADPTNSFFIG